RCALGAGRIVTARQRWDADVTRLVRQIGTRATLTLRPGPGQWAASAAEACMLVPSRSASCLFAVSAALLPAQNLIVDGDLEGHTATSCVYNLSIAAFNSYYANVHSFGISSGIDILRGTCYGLLPHSGATKLGLAWNNGGDKDAMSLDLAP